MLILSLLQLSIAKLQPNSAYSLAILTQNGDQSNSDGTPTGGTVSTFCQTKQCAICLAIILTLTPRFSVAQNSSPTSYITVPGFSTPIPGRWLKPGDTTHGIPLGGLGTGFLEIKPGGIFGEAALQPGGPAIPIPKCNLMAISRDPRHGRLVARTLMADEQSTVQPRLTQFCGRYPVADMTYGSADSLKISLRAFGCMVPSREDLSSIPAAIFRLSLINSTSIPRKVTLRFEMDASFARLLQPEIAETRTVATNISAKTGRGIQWRVIGSSATCTLMGGGTGWSATARFGSSATMTLTGTVPGNGAAHPDFTLAWHTPSLSRSPNVRLNHYAAQYADSASVAAFAYNHAAGLDHATCSWQNAIYASGKPAWLTDALVNSLYVIPRSTSWTEQDGVTFNTAGSAPQVRSDWRYYGGLPMLLFFPELEKKSILRTLTAEETETKQSSASKLWSMLSFERAAIASLDRDFAVKILTWIHTNLDGLSAAGGGDSPLLRAKLGVDAFDGWKWQGNDSYTNSLYLAALEAALEVGKIADNQGAANRVNLLIDRIKTAFDEEFWSNGWYRLSADSEQFAQNDSSFLGQLSGLLDCRQCGLRETFNSRRCKSALAKVVELNGAGVRFGLINSSRADGKPDDSGAANSREVSPFLVYHLVANCLYSSSGATDDAGRDVALRSAESVWRGLQLSGNVWSQPSIFAAASGRSISGKDDLRNLAIWSIPLAMDGANLVGRAAK